MKPHDRPAEATPDLRKYAWLAIVTAVLTVLLKGSAWAITGSVGLLSDAAESMVNLVAAIVALISLTIAARPADEGHHFGHSKAEYFSALLEGVMIFVAAASIIYLGIERLLNPRPLQSLGIGLAISIVAAVLNGVVGQILIKVGTRHRSITLRADGRHLMTDVWTSVGVIVGVGLVAWSGWLWLDPVIALLVAANIVWIGYQLMRRSADGLMDRAVPAEDLQKIERLLADYRQKGLEFHALRTRQAGSRAFVTLHVLVPGHWSVQEGHDWAGRIEADIRKALEHADVTTHLEPIGDPIETEGPDAAA